MPVTDRSIRIPLRRLSHLPAGDTRNAEPVTVGVPLPAGLVASDALLELSANGHPVLVQTRTLDRWPDGSVRWVLVDLLADVSAEIATEYDLAIRSAPRDAPGAGITVSTTPDATRVDTGIATFTFNVGGSFPVSNVEMTVPGRGGLGVSRFEIVAGGVATSFSIASVTVHEVGPVRAEIELRGQSVVPTPDNPIAITARVELFAGSATARLTTTLWNPRRARHPNGHWELGDTGSILLDSAVLRFQIDSFQIDSGARVTWTDAPTHALRSVAVPFDLRQASSGGERWNGPVHVNAQGSVDLAFRGYRARTPSSDEHGNRATPVVGIATPAGRSAFAMPGFWERFPKAISVSDGMVELSLLPKQAAPHELQGGERKTDVVVVAYAADAVSEVPLAWCHEPSVFAPSPEWFARSEAMPFLIPAATDPNRNYLDLLELALDPSTGFLAKREAADEYGWRNFGDLPADHESAFRPAGAPFVSHYNNQYDALAGFGVHFMRTGDVRWRRLMIDLALHVRDIDIYQTTDDKSAYSGGLFWHTDHYVDAGKATHRTYPSGTAGGGPSSEHNYNVGLMLHYFLTGDRASRDAAIGLGRWVLRMDDGRQTVFRWLAGGAPTGLASFTVDYHGPGRGAGHSILACLTAHRLSGDRAFLTKAEELIRRCAHPEDDQAGMQLLNAERRWSYTVFLQVLGIYLVGKEERAERDGMHAYASATLLAYARWMAGAERPYLDHPEELEFPTETWAAQDLRKADVFLWAALFSGGPERARFLQRAEDFFRDAIATLAAMPSTAFTRPLVLLMTNGYRYGWFRAHAAELPVMAAPVTPAAWPAHSTFVSQKDRAMRRAMAIATVALAGGAVAVAAYFLL
jgi:hypothetical protein